MADLGLSDPLAVQYFRWVGDIARGNFGRSFFRAESVGEMILRRGPLTAEIAVLSVILSWLVGIPVAIVSALRPNSLGDNVSRFLSILFLAVPGFWLGMLIVLAALFMFGYRAPLDRPHIAERSVGQSPGRDRAGGRSRARPGRLHRPHGAFQPAWRSSGKIMCARPAPKG